MDILQLPRMCGRGARAAVCVIVTVTVITRRYLRRPRSSRLVSRL